MKVKLVYLIYKVINFSVFFKLYLILSIYENLLILI